jgi:hypothetical protein
MTKFAGDDPTQIAEDPHFIQGCLAKDSTDRKDGDTDAHQHIA